MDRFVYVGLCIALPLVWGLLAAVVSRRLDARSPSQAQDADERLPNIDYYI